MEKKSKIEKALAVLQNPHLALSSIFHITGTVGKTSIGKYLSSILRQGGYSVNTYAGGNIYPNSQRININGHWITNNALSKKISQIQEIAEQEKAKYSPDETLFLAALKAFKNNPAQVNIIETEEGNIDDPTNIFQHNQPIANIVATIHIDHTTTNGNTVELNAIAQTATINKNATIILSKQAKSVQTFFEEIAKTQNCKLYTYGKDFWIEENPQEENIAFSTEWKSLFIQEAKGTYTSYQLQNIATALMAIEENISLFPNINEEAIKLGLQKAAIEGQLQKVKIPTSIYTSQKAQPPKAQESQKGIKNIIVDFASNPIAAQQISQYISKRQTASLGPNFHIIFSGDKASNYIGLMAELKQRIKSFTIVENQNTNNPISPKEILQAAIALAIPQPKISPTATQAINEISTQDPTGQIIMLGCASLVQNIWEEDDPTEATQNHINGENTAQEDNQDLHQHHSEAKSTTQAQDALEESTKTKCGEQEGKAIEAQTTGPATQQATQTPAQTPQTATAAQTLSAAAKQHSPQQNQAAPRSPNAPLPRPTNSLNKRTFLGNVMQSKITKSEDNQPQ